jgi:hypothetical protein
MPYLVFLGVDFNGGMACVHGDIEDMADTVDIPL